MDLHADRHVDAVEDPLDSSLSVALDALERALRRRSDQRTKTVLQIEVYRLGGFSRSEIQDRMALTAGEYAWAWRELRATVEAGADEP